MISNNSTETKKDFLTNINNTDQSCFRKRKIVLGCGNILFGDDGFGPELINYIISNWIPPEDVCLLDVGTSSHTLLFDILLDDNKPEKLIIVDAGDKGYKPGELFFIDIDEIPHTKLDNFSFHLMPGSNLLKELKETHKVDIKILVVQVKSIPAEVNPGLSKEVQDAIPLAYNIIKKLIC